MEKSLENLNVMEKAKCVFLFKYFLGGGGGGGDERNLIIWT